MLEKELEKLGMNDREAAVYTAALKLGPTTAIKIARSTNIKRTTVYGILESLKQRGLVAVELAGLKQYFVAAAPEQFESLMAEQRKTFERIMPELMALHKLRGSKGELKYYEGSEGIKSVYESVLREMKNGDPYYLIAYHENLERMDEVWLADFIMRRAKKSLDARLIFLDTTQGQLNKRMERAWNQHVRLMSRPLHFKADALITPTKFVLYSTDAPASAVVIENPDMIVMQQELFRYIWDSLPA